MAAEGDNYGLEYDLAYWRWYLLCICICLVAAVRNELITAALRERCPRTNTLTCPAESCKRMNWRHKMALERFAAARRGALRFYETPGVGEASWKTLIAEGWIAARPDLALALETKWWQIPHEITAAGRAALVRAGDP